MGRLGIQEELANAVVFIAPDEASFIADEVVNVDGGKTRQIAARCTSYMRIMYRIHWTHDPKGHTFFAATRGRGKPGGSRVFVVLGASGNTGRVVAETLLSQGKAVRVVVRDAVKGRAWKDAGAEVAIADVEDGAALAGAFRGADGAYVLIPPNFSSTQVRLDNDRRASTIAAAIEAGGVPHVVLLSSIGAQAPRGTGPVLGLRDAEATFTRGRAAATFIRAAYFMENWSGALLGVAHGVLPTFLRADRAIPLVATRDVGTAAARVLAEGGNGKRVIELAGPREYSPRDVAAALARVVGKPIAVQEAPEDEMGPTLTSSSMNAEWAQLFQELIHGLNVGIVAWEGGHPLWRGETEVGTVLATLIGK
jgi:uncharacterized protein YbjT (DUF2867 family)